MLVSFIVQCVIFHQDPNPDPFFRHLDPGPNHFFFRQLDPYNIYPDPQHWSSVVNNVGGKSNQNIPNNKS